MQSETHAQIIDILDRCVDMTIATIRPDGFPQATVVSYVHDDLRIYFATMAAAQKARNIAASDRVSLTMTPPYETWDEIEGLSIGGHASAVTDAAEAGLFGELMAERFPETEKYLVVDPGEVVIFRIDPVVVSILDYRRGFVHTDLVTVQERVGAVPKP